MGKNIKKDSMKIVPPGKKRCIWMEAGVVSYKLCDNNYDCSTCVYDQAMQLKVARQKEAGLAAPDQKAADQIPASWVEKMMQLPSSQRKCRYMITGEVVRKLCPNSYECGNCAFDQMMQERVQTDELPVKTTGEVAGFGIAEDFYYHEGHTWARPEYGGRVRVGLDDFAQRFFKNPSRIELPNTGQSLSQGKTAFTIRKNGDTAQVLSPIDGLVVRVNEKIAEQSELVNKSPYGEGWLFIVEPASLRKNLKGLYFGENAKAFLKEEKERLFNQANKDLSLAADGGVSVDDILSELDGENWSEFVKVFFRS